MVKEELGKIGDDVVHFFVEVIRSEHEPVLLADLLESFQTYLQSQWVVR